MVEKGKKGKKKGEKREKEGKIRKNIKYLNSIIKTFYNLRGRGHKNVCPPPQTAILPPPPILFLNTPLYKAVQNRDECSEGRGGNLEKTWRNLLNQNV